MSKWARIIDNTIAEVVTQDPATLFTSQIAALFEPVSEDAVYMATWDGSQWVPPPAPDPVVPPEPPAPVPPKVSPVEFKLLFTSAERLEIKRHRLGDEAATPALAPDAIIGDWFDIIDDPRLTTVDLALQSTQDGLAYLVSLGIITEARMSEILTGRVR